MNKIFTNLLVALSLLFLTSSAFAQSGVGKISGKVLDADTREPLIGANIILMGTNLGAATDIDGSYFILNITPGTYNVKVSYVGYAPKTIQGVRIVSNLTYELDVELSTDFTLPEIVVEDKKFFEEKSTNTVKVIDSDQIDRLPVRGVSSIASLQSGVVVAEGDGGQSGNAEINVRGGRGSEVLYIVDGIPQNNLYNRDSESQVANIAIDQISFQIGGFEAKYGQSQSGIVSVTTKSGKQYYSLVLDGSTSTLTDDFGSNVYAGSFSGPIFPGVTNHSIFISAERGWWADGDPPAIKLEFPTNVPSDLNWDHKDIINTSYDYIPNNPADAWRFQGKTNSRFGDFQVILSALWNRRISKNVKSTTQFRSYAIRQLKNASAFLEEYDRENLSLSGRVTQTVSNSTFWNLTFGYRSFDLERYNPRLRDADYLTNLFRYGDSTYFANTFGATLERDGERAVTIWNTINGQQVITETDPYGVFYSYGWAYGLYQRREDDALNLDFDITSQLGNNLLEFGAGVEKHTVRGYSSFVYHIDGDYPAIDPQLASIGSHPTISELLRPREPIIAYAYLQDRLELEDLVLNLGLRLDYYDYKTWELRDISFPYGAGLDPDKFDIEDFKQTDPEVELSPRIGIGFPVTATTVFHANYGRFIQRPELTDMYGGPFDWDTYLNFDPQYVQNGSIRREETTSYELGFRQAFGNTSAIDINLFYRNIKGLVNRQNTKWQGTEGGELGNAITPFNSDFGTNKGVTISFDARNLFYFNLSLQYTFSIAEGTGSATNSSQTAVFRNQDNLAPKVIAPLDFDQRHTGVFTVDFYIPQGEAGLWEMFNITALFSFNSGRPYTPVDFWDILGDNGLSATNTGYINSAYGPGSFRTDLKITKGISVGDLIISPYLWINNVFAAENAVDYWRSTGSPYTTNHLNTESGQTTARNNFLQTGSDGYEKDYASLEKDPRNFGIPRQIILGLKVDFTRF
jgi:hypothetical protein